MPWSDLGEVRKRLPLKRLHERVLEKLGDAVAVGSARAGAHRPRQRRGRYRSTGSVV
jgi:hypothetical protein